MTEPEWLTCTDTRQMLEFIRRRASVRKLRLFSVACCQRILPMVADARGLAAFLTAERFADGSATAEELSDAHDAAKSAWLDDPLDDALMACFHVSAKHVAGTHAVGTTARAVWMVPLGEARSGGDPVADPDAFLRPFKDAEAAAQCRLLRDIVGNPFRPLPPRKGRREWEARRRGWVAWQDGTVAKLAAAMYDDRAFDDMPILADALQDAGCGEAEILSHCRGPAPHVRGCFVLDLLLGKS